MHNELLSAVAAYVAAEGKERELARARVRQLLAGESAPPARDARTVEVTINKMLLELGVPSHIKGHSRLACAIRIAVEDPTAVHAVTRKLYPGVARQFGDTPSRVERAIRHAIELSFDRCDYRVIERYFGNTVRAKKGKPTNSEFISRLADVVRNGL